jgi:hypothetical protein
VRTPFRFPLDALRIARRVRRQRPHSAPAPQALAISFVVNAPCAMASATVWLVMPLHKHTNTEWPDHCVASICIMSRNLPTKIGG